MKKILVRFRVWIWKETHAVKEKKNCFKCKIGKLFLCTFLELNYNSIELLLKNVKVKV